MDKLEYLKTEQGIFTNNIMTGQTAKEVYQEWLINKDKPPVIIPNDIEILKQKVADLDGRIGKMEKVKEIK